MPAKSKKQQMAAGAALATKKGERSKSSLRGASKSMVEFDEQEGARTHGVDAAQGQARDRQQEVQLQEEVAAGGAPGGAPAVKSPS